MCIAEEENCLLLFIVNKVVFLRKPNVINCSQALFCTA